MRVFLNYGLLIVVFLSFSFCSKSQPNDRLMAYQPINTIHAVPFKDLKTNLFGVYDTLTNKWLLPAIYNEIDFIDGDKRLLLVLEKEKYSIITLDKTTVHTFKSNLWVTVHKRSDNCFSTVESTFSEETPMNSLIMLNKNSIYIKVFETTGYSFSDVLINPAKTVVVVFKDKEYKLINLPLIV